MNNSRARPSFPSSPDLKAQRGVYALEFALAFPVFFLVFYAVLSFSMVFVAKQTLSLAASDGARASLRYLHPNDPNASVDDIIESRRHHACQVALERASYLFAEGQSPQCDAVVDATCPANWACRIVTVTLNYPYRNQPLIPSLPGLNFFVPDRLTDQASVVLSDQALFGSGGG